MRFAMMLLGYLILGIPLVAYLWSTMNDVLALKVDFTRLVIAAVLIVLLVLLLRQAAKTIERST